MKYVADQEEKQKTYIVFCDKCGMRAHRLPHGYDEHGINDLKHRGCGGCITVSRTTTHDMLDHLTDEQAAILADEVADAIVRGDRLRSIIARQKAEQRHPW
ncbi:MAG: hypothetical protein ACI4O7_03515 [Aristaeellaceae bacterium]